ncbi:MAG: M3 family metallopeptidase [Betaproteobacteria bacterium]|nr:M3 family metallopeptidase [Betaproteobacteria bacterium]
MIGKQFAMLATTVMLASSTCSAADSAAFTSDNPFHAISQLPYQWPPFDRIKDNDYAPAFAAGMREQLGEITAIADNPEPAGFDNTIVAMERSGQLLQRVSKVFFNLTGANTNDALDAIERDLAPKLAAHRDAIMLNTHLFERVNALYQRRQQLALDPESLHLLERYQTDFKRAGAQLSESDKLKLKDLNAELARLKTRFNQNLLKETRADALVVESRDELAGLEESAVSGAAAAAQARGLPGKFVIELMNTSGQPSQTMLNNRKLRQRLHAASLGRGSHGGEFDTRATVLELARLRAERARLLGYPNHAAYQLEDETAQTTTAVNRLLAQLAPPALANARKEAAAMQEIVDAEGGGFQLAAYDWDFYAEKVRKARYAFDETQLRPYLELDSVLHNGVFYAASQLYGISLRQRHDLPVYHPDVRTYEVFDADGKPLALFLPDLYARGNKRGGAWMSSYVDQSGLFGTLPVIGNHLNIPKPPAGEPTLLTFDEVTTLFHEFGHALHGMFSSVRYPRFSGTHVPRDFVELPSQINEMWAIWPEVLKNYARHYQTGATMPPALIDKVIATKKFNQGFHTTEYLAAALLDQHWHQLTPEQIPDDVVSFETNALKQAGVDFPPVPPRYRSSYFSHIFGGGYSAGYYAYIWSEVMVADGVEWFKEHGGLSRKNGDWFRQQLLARGGSADAMNLYRTFRGREPKIDPLLESRGLKPKEK